ncbi:hypothetical protein D3C81_1345340 [compost metagenome]
MSSTGGGICPGRPRRRFTKLCCWVVNRRRDSASDSLATTFNARIAYGSRRCSEGLKSRRYSASASSIASGAKCEAKANDKPIAAESRALNRLEPSNHTGTSTPAPGTACTLCPGCAGAK